MWYKHFTRCTCALDLFDGSYILWLYENSLPFATQMEWVWKQICRVAQVCLILVLTNVCMNKHLLAPVAYLS